MPKRLANRADRIVRTTMREPVSFPGLTENRSIKLASVSDYAGRSHFAPWQRILAGMHDFEKMAGIFTPLVYVELETRDLACDPTTRVVVRGESFLGKSLDPSGAVRHLVREGRHRVLDANGTELAAARMLNVFTRYDADPARRRNIWRAPRRTPAERRESMRTTSCRNGTSDRQGSRKCRRSRGLPLY